MLVFKLIFVLTLFKLCECSKILALFTCASPSHGVWNRALVEELATRGHDVIALTPNPGKDNQNLRYILFDDSYTSIESMNMSIINIDNLSVRSYIDIFHYWMYTTCQFQLKSKGFAEVMKLEPDAFDVVIFEAVASDCFLGLLPKFKAPIVATSPFGCFSWSCPAYGMELPSSVYPDYNLEYIPGEMNFWQRIYSLCIDWYTYLTRYYVYMPMQESLASSVFGTNLPRFSEIEKNFSVLLVNEGPAGVDYGKAYSPSVIQVGCLQCRPGKPLPKDLAAFLDGAKDGAILFSLGTNAKCEEMVEWKRNAFFEVFASLPQRILWKCGVDTIPGLPKNVKLSPWIPQQDVLAHPNVKLFITHGGRLSTQESAYHAVPVLSMPVFSDQYVNAYRSEQQGVGLQLNLKDVTKSRLQEKINILLSDSKFKAAATRVSVLMKDQLETPMERAVFWIEHVIRHKGATHLKSPIMAVAWYQYYYVDVAAFFILIFIIDIYIISKLCCRKKRNISNDKKTK